MLVTPRLPLFQQTEAALAASAARIAEVVRPSDVTPTASTERQERHGTGLDGRPVQGTAIESNGGRDGEDRRVARPAVYRFDVGTGSGAGFLAHLLAQQSASAGLSSARAAATLGPGTGIAAYRAAQTLLRRPQPDGYELYGPYPPITARSFDLQV